MNYRIFTESCAQELETVQNEEQVIADCLEEVSLFGKKDVHPQLLSGGEKQRLLIARTKAGGCSPVFAEITTADGKNHRSGIVAFRRIR